MQTEHGSILLSQTSLACPDLRTFAHEVLSSELLFPQLSAQFVHSLTSFMPLAIGHFLNNSIILLNFTIPTAHVNDISYDLLIYIPCLSLHKSKSKLRTRNLVLFQLFPPTSGTVFCT